MYFCKSRLALELSDLLKTIVGLSVEVPEALENKPPVSGREEHLQCPWEPHQPSN
jgi:hypothetical protein